MKEYKAVLVSMSGVRVKDEELLKLGLTLPGFVERSKVIASLPSLGLLTIAAHTPSNWEIEYLEWDELEDWQLTNVVKDKPDLVAFSSLTARINETYKVAGFLRTNGIKVVIGGLHASVLPEEAMQYADAVVQGEGESCWKELLKDIETASMKKLYSSFNKSTFKFQINQDIIPRYDLLDIEKYNRISLQTTRGCPLDCHFCAASRLISRYKIKPVEQIRSEIESILDLWPKPFIELGDDNTFLSKEWSKELLSMFAKYPIRWFTETDVSIAYNEELLELLAISGCMQILIGFESAEPTALKGVDKRNWKYKQYDQYFRAIEKIQSYGISVNGCFILGFDTHTSEIFEQTEWFIKNSQLSEVQLTLLTPFPGTQLYQKLRSENRLLKDEFWDECTLFDLVFRPNQMTFGELKGGFKDLMSKVYAPEVVAQRKSNFKSVIKKSINEKHSKTNF